MLFYLSFLILLPPSDHCCSALVGVRAEHVIPLFIKVIQTLRQMSRGVTLQPKPFMTGQSAK